MADDSLLLAVGLDRTRWRVTHRLASRRARMRKSAVDCVRDDVALRPGHEAGLLEVDGALIDAASALSEDQRAAPWLFAWSYRRPKATRNAAGLRKWVAG